MFERLKPAMRQTHIMFYVSMVFLSYPYTEALFSTPKDWGLLLTTLAFTWAFLTTLWSENPRWQNLAWTVMVLYTGYYTLAYNPNFTWYLFYLGNLLAYRFTQDSLLSPRWLSVYAVSVGCYSYLTLTHQLEQQDILYLTLLVGFILLFSIAQRFGRLRELAQERQEAQHKQINLLLAENERHRIRRDLHDNLGHLFATLSVKSELTLTLMERDQFDAARAHIQDIHALTQEAMHQVRSIINDLDHRDLEEELHRLEQMLTISGLTVTIENQLGGLSLTQDQSSTLALCLIEASNNIIKHAHAQRVIIRLWHRGDALFAYVEDDGKGFGPEQENELHTIRDRLLTHAGQVTILNRQGPTQIQLKIPYEKG